MLLPGTMVPTCEATSTPVTLRPLPAGDSNSKEQSMRHFLGLATLASINLREVLIPGQVAA